MNSLEDKKQDNKKEKQLPIEKIVTWVVTTIFGSVVFKNNQAILVNILLLPFVKNDHYHFFLWVTIFGLLFLFVFVFAQVKTLAEIYCPKFYGSKKKIIAFAFALIYLVFVTQFWPNFFTNIYWPDIQESLYKTLGYRVFLDDTITVKASKETLEDIFEMSFFDGMKIQKLTTETNDEIKDVFKASPSLPLHEKPECGKTDIVNQEINNVLLYYYLQFKDSEEAIQHKNTAYGAMQLALWCVNRNYDPKDLIIKDSLDSSKQEIAQRAKSFVQKLYNKKTSDRIHYVHIMYYQEGEWKSTGDSENFTFKKSTYTAEDGKEYYCSPWFSVVSNSTEGKGTVKSISYDITLQDEPDGAIVVDSSYYYKKHFETDSPTTITNNMFCILVPKSTYNKDSIKVNFDIDREYYDAVYYRTSDGQILLTTGINSYSINVMLQMKLE